MFQDIPSLDVARMQGVTISNDGATIMKLLDIVHPAAKTLVNISMSQDAEARHPCPCSLVEGLRKAFQSQDRRCFPLCVAL